MKLAVLSDIHGNLPGLEKVLQDAEKWGAQGYLFLGDYTGEFPWPNEVVDQIKKLDNTYVIKGNREEYVKKMIDEDPATWIWQHQATTYWTMETLTEKNKEYLIALPERKELEFLGHSFFLSHKLEDFLPEVNHYIIRPYSFSPLEKAIPKEEMNKVFFDFLNQNPLVKEHLQSLPKGIYCFGHNHMPWILHYEEKTFINPGAIGGSLDGNPRLSYIQLTLGKNQLQGEIIRLSYNAEKMEEDIRLSSLYQRAGDWAELTIESLYTAEDEVIWLFENMKKWAKEEKRDHVFPIENKLWAQSVKRWEREKPFVRKYGENRETT